LEWKKIKNRIVTILGNCAELKVQSERFSAIKIAKLKTKI